VELLVTITVITVLATLVLPQLIGFSRPAERVAAGEAMERINRAINLYEQSGEAIEIEAGAGTEDELDVLELLQARREDVPGSPLLDPALVYPATTEEGRPRGVWDGQYFQLLEEGQAGEGLDFARPQLEN